MIDGWFFAGTQADTTGTVTEDGTLYVYPLSAFLGWTPMETGPKLEASSKPPNHLFALKPVSRAAFAGGFATSPAIQGGTPLFRSPMTSLTAHWEAGQKPTIKIVPPPTPAHS